MINKGNRWKRGQLYLIYSVGRLPKQAGTEYSRDMTAEEEVVYLRQEKSLLQEQFAQRDELIAQLQHDIARLREQVDALQEQLNKDSHASHLPPSSDRFHRQPKSLRKRSGKKPGGQSGLCWLHWLSARQIESYPLPLSGALTRKCTLSQVRDEHPCLRRQQTTDQDEHVSRACFLLQGKLSATACWFLTTEKV